VPGGQPQHPRAAGADQQPRRTRPRRGEDIEIQPGDPVEAASIVTAAAAARPVNGASCWPNAAAEKWSRSSSTSIPLSSTCRAKSSQARPSRTDSLTTPNRNLAMLRHATATGRSKGSLEPAWSHLKPSLANPAKRFPPS
jgi:hypothetical protein